jgi:murein DD-endopeptidase MepM/ murein hydrolase activator NlpD
VLPFYGTVRLTLPYGVEGDTWTAGYHPGVDLVGDDLRTVRAVRPGKVVRSQRYGAWGEYVVIKQDDGLWAIYAHLGKRNVALGQTICRGQDLGLMGATGNANGAHLHFELQRDYYDPHSTVNAAEYLGIRNRKGVVEHV